MKTKSLCLLLLGLLDMAALAQNADSLVAEGRAFLRQQDITNANSRFRAAVTISPNHETANVLYGFTRLLALPYQSAVSEFLDRLGVSPTNRNIYRWTDPIPRDTNGVPLAPANLSAAEATALLRTNILAKLPPPPPISPPSRTPISCSI